MKAGAEQNKTGKEGEGRGGRSLRELQREAVTQRPCGSGSPVGVVGGEEVTAHVGLGPWEKWGPLAGLERGGTEGPLLLKAKRAECVMNRNPHRQRLPPPTPWLSLGPNLHAYLSPWIVPEAWGRGSLGTWLRRGETGEAMPTVPHPQGAPTWPHIVTCFGGSRAGTNKFTPQGSPLGVHLGQSHGWQAG